jgi:hypothetical protein
MKIYKTIEDARQSHHLRGGWLLDLGGGNYMVTEDFPWEHRSFSDAEKESYLKAMLLSDYDETKLPCNWRLK